MRVKACTFLFIYLFIALTGSEFHRAYARPHVPHNKQVEAHILGRGETVEREILVGELHVYQVNLESGQTLHVAFDQRGVDVVVTAYAPDGKKLIRIDSPNGDKGTESIWLLADTSGAYRFEVVTWNTAIARGKYAARIVELRASVPEDKNRIAIQAENQRKLDLAEQPRLISIREAYAKEFSRNIATSLRKQSLTGRVEATGPDKTILRFITSKPEITSKLYWYYADAKKDLLHLKGSGFTKIVFNSGGKEDDFTISLDELKADPSLITSSENDTQETDNEDTGSNNPAKSRNRSRTQSPRKSSTVPAGATAECMDGTYSFSQNRRGTCSHHGGVKRWL